MIARLQELPIDKMASEKMIAKIKSVRLVQSVDCAPGPASDEGQSLAAFLVPNASYSEHSNSFGICGGYLFTSTSEFSFAQTIAHELSHSIDPCEVAGGASAIEYSVNTRAEAEKAYPVSPNLIACLRHQKSIGARVLQERPGPRFFCSQDQVTESFADWFAAEVIPRYITKNFGHSLSEEQVQNGYANTFRAVCERKSKINYDLSPRIHPSDEARINKIILANPAIRAQMGCHGQRKDTIYCDGIHDGPFDSVRSGDADGQKASSLSEKGAK